MKVTKETQPWETCIETCSDKRLANFMKALIMSSGKVDSIFRIGEEWDWRSSTYMIVSIPIDNEKLFEEISSCKLKKMPRIQVGMHTDPGFPYKGNFALGK